MRKKKRRKRRSEIKLKKNMRGDEGKKKERRNMGRGSEKR